MVKKISKLQKLRDNLKTLIFKKINKLDTKTLESLLRTVLNGRNKKIEEITNRLNNNNFNFDKKLLKFKKFKKSKLNHYDENTKIEELFFLRNYRKLNKKDKKIIIKDEIEKIGDDYNIKVKETKNNEIIKADYIKIKQDINYFKNVIRSREYQINSINDIIDENVYLNLLKEEVIEDIDNIRIELNENIKCIFILVVKFMRYDTSLKEMDYISVYFHHNQTMKKIKDQGKKS